MITEINNIVSKKILTLCSLLFSLSAVAIELTAWNLIYTPDVVEGIPVISSIRSYGLENKQNDFIDKAGNHSIKNNFSLQQRIVMLSLVGGSYFDSACFKKNGTEISYPVRELVQKSTVLFPMICLKNHFIFFEPSLYARINQAVQKTVKPDTITLVFKSLCGSLPEPQSACPDVSITMDPSRRRCEYNIDLGKMKVPFFLIIPDAYRLDHDDSCITCYESDRQCLSDVLKQTSGRKQRRACNNHEAIKRDPDRDIAFMVHFHPLKAREPKCSSDIWMIDRGKPEVSASILTAGIHDSLLSPELRVEQKTRHFQSCKVLDEVGGKVASPRLSIDQNVRDSLAAIKEMGPDFWRLLDYVYAFEAEGRSIGSDVEAKEYLDTLCRLLTLRAKVKVPCITYRTKSKAEMSKRKKIKEGLYCLDRIIIYASVKIFLYYMPFTPTAINDDDLQLVHVSVLEIEKIKKILPSLLTFYQLIKYPVEIIGEDDFTYIAICSYVQVYIQMLLSGNEIIESDLAVWEEFKAFVCLCMQRSGVICDGALNAGFLIKLLSKASCLNDVEFILRVSGWISAILHKIYFDPAAQQDAVKVYGRAWGVLKENKVFFTGGAAGGNLLFRLESFLGEANKVGVDVSEWQKVLTQWNEEQIAPVAQKTTINDRGQDIDALLAYLDIETEKLDIIRADRKRSQGRGKARKKTKKREVRKTVTQATGETEELAEIHVDSQSEEPPEWERECAEAASLAASQDNNWTSAVMHFEKALETAAGGYEKACIHSVWADSHFIPGEKRLRSIYNQSRLSASYLEKIQKAFGDKEYPVVQADHLNKLAKDLVGGVVEFANASQRACQHHQQAITLLSSLPIGVDKEQETFYEASSLLGVVIQQEQATRHIRQVLVQAIDNLTQAYQLRLQAIKQKKRLEPRHESAETKARKSLEKAMTVLAGTSTKGVAKGGGKIIAQGKIDYEPCLEQLDNALENFKKVARKADLLQKNWEKAASGAVSL